MSMTFLEANATITGPGQIFELIDAEVRGVKMRVFKNAPAHLGQLFAGSRAHGDKPFLVYENETFTFAQAADHIDALASLLVNTYGVKKETVLQLPCVTSLNGSCRLRRSFQ